MSCTCGSTTSKVCIPRIGGGQGSSAQCSQSDVTGSGYNGAYAGIHTIRNGDITAGCAVGRCDCEVDRDNLSDHRWVGEIAGDEVVVLIWLTIWAAPAEVLPAKFVLPA